MNIFQHAAWGWVWRRAQDWGGWGTLLVSLYLGLPPDMRRVIEETIQTGDWQSISLGTIVGFVLFAWSQIQSYRATTRTQMVADGKVTLPVPQDKPVVREAAQEVRRKPNPIEQIAERIGWGSSR